MWECPICGRSFKRKDQNHSCVLISSASLFEKRPEELKQLYKQICKEVKKFGSYKEETVKPDFIFFKTKSTFLGIKVKKDHLEIEFFLDHLEDIPPVYKHLQTSKNRIVHILKIDTKEEVNDQLIIWMKQSYNLVSN